MVNFYRILFFASLILSIHSIAGTPKTTKWIETFQSPNSHDVDKETGKDKAQPDLYSPQGKLISVEFESQSILKILTNSHNKNSFTIMFPNHEAAATVKELLEGDQDLTFAFEVYPEYPYLGPAHVRIKLPDSEEYISLEANPENVLNHTSLGRLADCVFPKNINHMEADSLFSGSLIDDSAPVPYLVGALEITAGVSFRRIGAIGQRMPELLAGVSDSSRVQCLRSLEPRAKKFKFFGTLLIVDGVATPALSYFNRQIAPTALTRSLFVGGKYIWDEGSELINSSRSDEKGPAVKDTPSQSPAPAASSHQ